MSKREELRIRKSLAPFFQMMLVIACLGLLASCGGGGASSSNTAPNSSNELISQIPGEKLKDTSYGKIFLGYLMVYPSNGVTRKNIESFINSKNWELSSYSEMANVYQINTKATSIADMEQAKNTAISSGLFGQNVYFERPSNRNVYLPTDEAFNFPEKIWNIKSIHALEAWGLMAKSKLDSITVGVLDDGFYNIDSAPDLYLGHVFSKQSSLICGYDNYLPFYPNSGCEDHGYHVSGIIGAKSNNELGTSGIGSAVNDLILNGGNSLDGTQESISFAYLAVNGAKIINFSKGNAEIPGDGIGGVIDDAQYEKIINNAKESLSSHVSYLKWRYDPSNNNGNSLDILIIQASGNGGNYHHNNIIISSENNGVYSNASNSSDPWVIDNIFKKSIIVGAYDKDKKISKYTQLPATVSARGNFILAPGDSIFSTTRSGLNSKTGTSMAAPHVSGVAALVLQINSKLKANEIRDIILNNSDSIIHTDGVTYRALNAEKAVQAALDTLGKPTVSFTATPTAPKAGEAVTFKPTATSANGAIKTYAWDFGDGTTAQDTTGGNQVHNYISAKPYTVTLTVTDEKGKTATSSQTVTVAPVVALTPAITDFPTTTATVGVATQFTINGTNLPTTTSLNIYLTGRTETCSGFTYGTKSATVHTFSCTFPQAGSTGFDIFTSDGLKLKSIGIQISTSNATGWIINPNLATYKIKPAINGDYLKIDLKINNSGLLPDFNEWPGKITLILSDSIGGSRLHIYLGNNPEIIDYASHGYAEKLTRTRNPPANTEGLHTYSIKIGQNKSNIIDISVDNETKYSEGYGGKFESFDTLIVIGSGTIFSVDQSSLVIGLPP